MFSVYSLVLRVQGLGCREQGLGFRVYQQMPTVPTCAPAPRGTRGSPRVSDLRFRI